MSGAINHVIIRGLNHQNIFLTTATGMTFLIDRTGKRPKHRDARSVARDVSETVAAMANPMVGPCGDRKCFSCFPEDLFHDTAYKIVQKHPEIGKRAETYPDRISRHVLNCVGFDKYIPLRFQPVWVRKVGK